MSILLSLAVAEGLYVRALRILRGRGVGVPRGQVAPHEGHERQRRHLAVP